MKIKLEPENETDVEIEKLFWEGYVYIQYDPKEDDVKFNLTQEGRRYVERDVIKRNKDNPEYQEFRRNIQKIKGEMKK